MTPLRTMTDAIVDALNKAGVNIRRVERCKEYGDSDGIYLDGDHALFIDYEMYPVICVSLDELMPIGGNVEIADWTLKDNDSVESVVQAVKQL